MSAREVGREGVAFDCMAHFERSPHSALKGREGIPIGSLEVEWKVKR